MRKAVTLESPRTGVIAHVHPETSISKQQTHQSGEPIWHAFSQFVKKTNVPDNVICCCYVQKNGASLKVLLESIFDESGEGSNLITTASTFPETSLVWTEQTFYCARNALECKMLQELVTHPQQ